MSDRKRSLAIAVALVVVALLSLARDARAQDWSRVQEQMDQARAQARPDAVTRLSAGEAPSYGTQDSSYAPIDAYAFQGAQAADHLEDDGNGYRHLATLASGYLAASVNLPAGALIHTLAVSACSTTGALTMALYDAGVAGQPIALLTSLTTFGDSCGLFFHSSPNGVLYSNP